MRILFITSTRVGDAVLSTGILSYLIDRYPGARVTVVAGPAAAPVFQAMPGLEQLMPITKMSYGRHWFGLWKQCAFRRWDIVVDLRRSLIAWMLIAGERYVIPKIDAPMHRVELLAATLGLRDAPPSPRLWTDQSHEATAASMIPDGPAVLALAPAANWRGKQWAADRFVALAGRLTAPDGPLPGAPVAVFAAASERDQIDTVLSQIPAEQLIDTVGAIDLPTIAACLKRCALFVGNDSGLMHMAAACDTPTLGLFGPSKQEHYAPWGPHTAWVRTPESFDELTGASDYNHRTTGSLMGGLSVDQAEAAARALWQTSQSAAP